MLGSQSKKISLLRYILIIGVKKFLYGLKGEKILGKFLQKKVLQETNHKEFRIEKLIKRKGNKLYVKWKGYDNSLDSWIDKRIL